MIRGYKGPQRQPINQPRIGNILDPLGNGKKWTNVWGAVMNVPQPSSGIAVSPTPTPTASVTPTPSITPTLTPTKTSTPTPTPTASSIPSGTTEANTFLAAARTAKGSDLGSTVSAATTTLFTSLVSNNLWDKLTIFYPMIGGTSAPMAVQGKSPGTNNMTWNGGWTFTASAATGNGTNAYGNTGYNDSGSTLNDFHMAIYSFVANTNSGIDCGVEDVPRDSRSSIYTREDSGSNAVAGFNAHNQNSGYLTWTTGNTINNGSGLFVVNRSGSAAIQGYRNGIQVLTDTLVSTNTAKYSYYIGAKNSDGAVAAYSNRGYNWFSIGKSLTQAEQATFSTIINTFQTSLSRNTY